MVLSILAYVAAIIYVVLLHIKKELSIRILGIILKYSRLSKGHLDSFFFTKLHSTNLDGTRDIQNETFFFLIFCEFEIQRLLKTSLSF